MAFDLPLERMQRWMQSIVVHPSTAEAALAEDEAQAIVPADRVAEVILPSRTLDPAQRLAIYNGMYPMRMMEALQTDYPGLAHFLGEGRFYTLVQDYVQVHPSRAYTLNRLGDHLPEFVRTTRMPKREFCTELARLELALTQVFDEEETPALTAAEIEAVPEGAWEHAVLAPVAAFRLLALRYPASAYLDSMRSPSHDHPKIHRHDSWIAIYRRSFGVLRHDLTRPGFDLLSDLAAGTPLGRAIERALARPGKQKPSEHEMFRWFREWVSGGVFRSVTLTPA